MSLTKAHLMFVAAIAAATSNLSAQPLEPDLKRVNPQLRPHLEDIERFCFPVPMENRKDVIECFKQVSNGTSKLYQLLDITLQRSVERFQDEADWGNLEQSMKNAAQIGVALTDLARECDSLSQVRGKLEDVLRPVLGEIHACMDKMHFVAYGKNLPAKIKLLDYRENDALAISLASIQGGTDSLRTVLEKGIPAPGPELRR